MEDSDDESRGSGTPNGDAPHSDVNGDGEGSDATAVKTKLKDATEENQQLSENQRHLMKHRELFLSRQVETLPATHIRGKCTVTLLNETEALLTYLNKDDSFFYTFVYDASQKTLLADRGNIRVGALFQAEIQPLLAEGGEDDSPPRDELIWSPENGLAEAQMEQFVLVARSVGTLARALDCSSAVRQPSVVMSAAAASRDVTLFKALQLLHDQDYNLAKAMCALTPTSGLLLCRDEMEEWSASESNLFEEAMDKYGKDFYDLRKDFLPWKTAKAIVEYYYMWKTTDRHVQQKRIKAMEAERKLKQVYIPNYNKPNPAVLYNKHDSNGRGCESCYATSSNQWYAWGPPHMQCRLCANCWTYWKKYGGLKMPTRLEKVVAGQQPSANGIDGLLPSHRCTVAGCEKEFRLRTQLLRHLQMSHSVVVSDTEMAAATAEPSMAGVGGATDNGLLSLNDKKAKNNKAMLMLATPSTRVARRLCSALLGGTRRCALNPSRLIDPKPASAQYAERATKTRSSAELQRLVTQSRMSSRALLPTLHKLGVPRDTPLPAILARHTDAGGDTATSGAAARQLSYPADPVALRSFFAALDQSAAAAAAAAKAEERQLEAAPPVKMCASQPSLLKKRAYEHANGVGGSAQPDANGPPACKRPLTTVASDKPTVAATVAATPTAAASGGGGGGQRPVGTSNHVGSKASGRAVKQYLQTVNKTGQGGTPQDSYLLVTPHVRKARRVITLALLRRAARRPGRSLQLSAAAAAAVAALKPAAAAVKTSSSNSGSVSNGGGNNNSNGGSALLVE